MGLRVFTDTLRARRPPIIKAIAHMKINANRIPEEGVRDHATYDPADLDMEREDIHLTEPVEVDAIITRFKRELVVQAKIRCPIRLTCARCLEEFPSAVAANAIFHYEVLPPEIVDTTDDVRQEVILAYPMVPVCQPSCKGLCRICGHNLNTGICEHQQSVEQR